MIATIVLALLADKEKATIPSEILIPILLGIVGWLSYMTYRDMARNGRHATLETDTRVMSAKLDSIIKKQDNLEGKLNLFLKTEIDTLKSLAEKR